ncbi:MAG: DUF4326 domain-containing protein [Patescibacteria group bacterium]|nr:DUF4326 domain-containing protein [Patescibacteria group bacterium]
MTEGRTTVVHVNDGYDVYIGRAVGRKGLKGSPWANPFKVTLAMRMWGLSPEEARSKVIELYRDWVQSSRHPRAAWIRKHVQELAGKRLGCWCKPEDGFRGRLLCHGQILAGLVDCVAPEDVE